MHIVIFDKAPENVRVAAKSRGWRAAKSDSQFGNDRFCLRNGFGLGLRLNGLRVHFFSSGEWELISKVVHQPQLPALVRGFVQMTEIIVSKQSHTCKKNAESDVVERC